MAPQLRLQRQMSQVHSNTVLPSVPSKGYPYFRGYPDAKWRSKGDHKVDMRLFQLKKKEVLSSPLVLNPYRKIPIKNKTRDVVLPEIIEKGRLRPTLLNADGADAVTRLKPVKRASYEFSMVLYHFKTGRLSTKQCLKFFDEIKQVYCPLEIGIFNLAMRTFKELKSLNILARKCGNQSRGLWC